MRFASGPGSLPGINFRNWVSPTTVVRINGGEAVHFTATASLGTGNEFAFQLDLYPCFSDDPNAEEPIAIGRGVRNIEIVGPALQTYTLSAVLGDVDGDVTVGLCGEVPFDIQGFYPWNRVGDGYVSAIVGNLR